MTKLFRGKRILLLVSVLVLHGIFTLFWQMPSIVESQTKPLTIAQIYTVLNSRKDENGKSWTIADRNKRAVRDVKKVGVNFALTAENERGLRESGATNELIQTIRQNSLPLPTPTQTPISNNAKTFKNSIGMEFVKIPAGTFMMGSNDYDDEKPVHQVTISRDFYLGKYEVTQAQWKAVMGNNPSEFSSCGNDCPVENVSWEDVQEFIKKLNEKDSETYRLPTEAEWEYAARAGTTTKWSFGDNENRIGDYAWYSSNSGDKTHEVGTKKANDFGLYDMHGNVWEWCADWYGAYSSSAQTNPSGAAIGLNRVNRGGGWFGDAVAQRSAVRNYFSPSNRSFIIGFRLLRN